MAHIKLFLFGPPRIARYGQRIEISLNKSIALLAYLALNKQSYSRDSLATLLWPDADQSTGLGYLRRALYRVNQALEEDVLSATRQTIEFNQQRDVWLDIDAFREHLNGCLSATSEPNCVGRLTKAVELYTDNFMAGFTLPDSPAYDEWQFFQAESLRRSCARTLEGLMRIHRARSEWEKAINYARRWLALDSLDEVAQRCLMELYAQTNQPAAALRQFEACRRVLSQELGIAPEEETTVLYESIKSRQVYGKNEVPGASRPQEATPILKSKNAGKPADAETASNSLNDAQRLGQMRPNSGLGNPGPPHNLPIQANTFIGRSQELSAVQRLLVDDSCCRLVTIIGPGGIGKTRLALETARTAIRSFSDGECFIPLASRTSADDILTAIAEQLGLRFYDGSQIKQQLFHYLRTKHMLLILDNFEHLLSAAGLVGEILQTAPQVKILVTSCERLNLSIESVYALKGMAFPQVQAVEEGLEYGAAQLLIHYARLARPDLALQAHDYAHIARICRLVQGMPLALVLAAGWVELLSFEAIADEIAQSLDFLEGSMQDLPERQRSVRATFEYAWKRLSPVKQRVFARLSLFRGGFSREAARQVAGADLRTLRSLIDKSLVSTTQDARYEVHELLRQYGEEQLETSGEAYAVHTAHSDYYLDMLAQRQRHLKGHRQLVALDEIESDFRNIRAAWSWAVQERNEAALERALDSLYLFFTFRSRYAEGIEFFDIAHQQLAPRPMDEPGSTCGRVLARLAWLQSLDRTTHADMEANPKTSLALAQKAG